MADEALRVGTVVFFAPIAFGLEIGGDFGVAQGATSSGTPCSLHHHSSWLCVAETGVAPPSVAGLSEGLLQPTNTNPAMARAATDKQSSW